MSPLTRGLWDNVVHALPCAELVVAAVGSTWPTRFSGLALTVRRDLRLRLDLLLSHRCYKHAHRACDRSVSRYDPELNGVVPQNARRAFPGASSGAEEVLRRDSCRGRRRDFGACACRCRAISVVSCNRSSMRKCARPADACTNGSGDAKLVRGAYRVVAAGEL
jgi:hypothetical protein